MAVLAPNSIRRYSLALGVLLALAPPALAADVSVQLDSGAGFSVKNNTGPIERLRVDEATGNLSHNGALFVHTTGTNNTFVGQGAGNTSTTGYVATPLWEPTLSAPTPRAMMAPMLLNEMQKQQQVIAEFSSRLERLEGKPGSPEKSRGAIR